VFFSSPGHDPRQLKATEVQGLKMNSVNRELPNVLLVTSCALPLFPGLSHLLFPRISTLSGNFLRKFPRPSEDGNFSFLPGDQKIIQVAVI